MWIALAAPGAAVPIACSDDPVPDLVPGPAAASAASSASSGSGGGGEPADGGADHDDDAPDTSSIFEAGCEPVQYFPEPRDPCGIFVKLPCGLPPSIDPGAGGGCYFLLEDCNDICPTLFFNCHAADESCDGGAITPDPMGVIAIDCAICNGAGRMPAGLGRARRARAGSALGAYFVVASYLEGASVHAFRRLTRELGAHGAPAHLVRAARRALRDEVRHARVTSRLARRFGGIPVRAAVAPMPTRDFETVAIENAIEGCVRETYGALVATWQASHAADAEVRRAMREIARDETRHAALSWRVAKWAWPRLDALARARLVAGCRDAVESLRRDATPAGVANEAGLPGAAERAALLAALESSLWNDLAA